LSPSVEGEICIAPSRIAIALVSPRGKPGRKVNCGSFGHSVRDQPVNTRAAINGYCSAWGFWLLYLDACGFRALQQHSGPMRLWLTLLSVAQPTCARTYYHWPTNTPLQSVSRGSDTLRMFKGRKRPINPSTAPPAFSGKTTLMGSSPENHRPGPKWQF
jgi:hypothetical protein